MIVTTRERMVQLSSSINALLNVIEHEVSNEVLDKVHGRLHPHTTRELLHQAMDIAHIIGDGKDPHYYTDIECGYTEETFPHESY